MDANLCTKVASCSSDQDEEGDPPVGPRNKSFDSTS